MHEVAKRKKLSYPKIKFKNVITENEISEKMIKIKDFEYFVFGCV